MYNDRIYSGGTLDEVEVTADNIYENPKNRSALLENNSEIGGIGGILPSSMPLSTESLPSQTQKTNYAPIDSLEFYLPKYSYSDYINNMSSWQKQLRDINGQIGWFYFKLFFNFESNYGLLGGVIDKSNAQNTAFQYLDSISGEFQYQSCKIHDRQLALCKFVNMLKHMSIDVPWFFRSVTGLAGLKYPYTSEFQKERSIGIECSEEAVDMRIGTLIDLYKYACFDHIYSREIIPANLRKFDMSLVLMHVPLKYHHEPTIYKNNASLVGNRGKSLDMSETNKFSGLASFKMFTFQNCEINLDGASEYYGDDISNETPFQMGKNRLKINYDRVYEHRMNEWNEFLLGDDGFYYNNQTPFELLDSDDAGFYEINSEGFSSIHQQLLKEMNANRTTRQDYLISYSDYFINKVWDSHYRDSAAIWFTPNDLSNQFRETVSAIKDNYRSIADNYKNIGNAWANAFKKPGDTENP